MSSIQDIWHDTISCISPIQTPKGHKVTGFAADNNEREQMSDILENNNCSNDLHVLSEFSLVEKQIIGLCH